MDEDEKEKQAIDDNSVEVIPTCDWIIHCPPLAEYFELKKGIPVIIDKRFLPGLILEGVVLENQKERK